MIDIIVCTTAITRPDLHRSVFTKYVEFMKGVTVHWLINIDPIPDGPSVDETSRQLMSIIDDNNISVEFSTNESGGTRSSFFRSAGQLINKVENMPASKYGVLWLEDDWLYTGEYLLKDILPHNEAACEYVQLVDRNKEVSFNPGIITMPLFKHFILNIKDKTHGHYGTNPERTCVSPKEKMDKLVDAHYVCTCFSDIGRQWQLDNKINRTFNITD